MNKWFAMNKSYAMTSICLWARILSSRGMGLQGLGMVHLGVCPWVYLHLLYLDWNYTWSFMGIRVMGKLWKTKGKNQWDYATYDTYLICIVC